MSKSLRTVVFEAHTQTQRLFQCSTLDNLSYSGCIQRDLATQIQWSHCSWSNRLCFISASQKTADVKAFLLSTPKLTWNPTNSFGICLHFQFFSWFGVSYEMPALPLLLELHPLSAAAGQVWLFVQVHHYWSSGCIGSRVFWVFRIA